MSAVATDLALEFRESAQVFREHAQEPVAIAYERCAERVEEAFDEQSGVLLTLQEAAAESGYSADHLGRLVREEKIPNAGRPNAPRIRRADLPSKSESPLSPVAEDTTPSDTSFAQVVQSIIDEGVE